MEHKHSNFRLFNCFSISVLFHSLLVLGLGFAPAMMLLKKGQNDGSNIEVAVVTEPATSTVEVPTPSPVPQVVEKKVAKKPVEKKIEKKIVTTDIAPQPAIEVAETLNESPVVVQDSDSNELQQVAEQPQVAQEEVQEQALPEKVEEVKAEEVAAVAAAPEQAPKTEETQTSQEVASGQQGTANQAANQAATQDAPQNFLSLKQLSGNQPPKYPEEMRFKRAEGRGQLQYYVTKSGTVKDVKITQSSGHAELDKAAAEAFAKYKFVPGQEGYTVHNFEFTLKGPAEAATGRLRTTYKK